ncbi:MAG TPA: winged helix-turn-helix domain-containing protein [Solirubrobacterales bacterium]
MGQISAMGYEMVDALAHPIRLEILQILQGRVASSVEISEEIGQKLGVVSYHAGTLVRWGCLELVESRAKRGGIENFFAITPRCLPGDRD